MVGVESFEPVNAVGLRVEFVESPFVVHLHQDNGECGESDCQTQDVERTGQAKTFEQCRKVANNQFHVLAMVFEDRNIPGLFYI